MRTKPMVGTKRAERGFSHSDGRRWQNPAAGHSNMAERISHPCIF